MVWNTKHTFNRLQSKIKKDHPEIPDSGQELQDGLGSSALRGVTYIIKKKYLMLNLGQQHLRYQSALFSR